MRKAILLCLAALALAAPAAHGRGSVAQLCTNCAFGDRRNYCIKCGAYTFGKGVPARLCENCGFGERWKYCVKCGAYTFGTGRIFPSVTLSRNVRLASSILGTARGFSARFPAGGIMI